MNANSRSPEPPTPGPPEQLNLQSRLTVLERCFDTILPTLATKADVLELGARIDLELMKLRVDLMKAMHEQTKWLTVLSSLRSLACLGSPCTSQTDYPRRAP